MGYVCLGLPQQAICLLMYDDLEIDFGTDALSDVIVLQWGQKFSGLVKKPCFELVELTLKQYKSM